MITTCIVIALAAATAAVTIARSRAFGWLRDWTGARVMVWAPTANRGRILVRRPGWELLDALVRCPYCISHWLVLVAAVIYRPRLVHSGWAVLDVAVTAFAVIAVAASFAAVLGRAYTFASPEEGP